MRILARQIEYPIANKEYPTEEGTGGSRSLATNADQQQNTVVTATTWSLDIPCWLLDIENNEKTPRPGDGEWGGNDGWFSETGLFTATEDEGESSQAEKDMRHFSVYFSA